MPSPELDDLSRVATDVLHVGVGFVVLALQHTTDQRRVVAEQLGGARDVLTQLRTYVAEALARPPGGDPGAGQG